LEAVQLVRGSARPVTQIARELGISGSVWYRWTAEHRRTEAHSTTRAAQRGENEELARVKAGVGAGHPAVSPAG